MSEPTEAEKSKRKVWQFHLMTAIAAALVSGLLLRANVINRLPNGEPFIRDWQEEVFSQYGWPLIARTIVDPNCFGSPITRLHWELRWNRFAVAIDALVAVGILIAFAFTSEWLIRRREHP